MKTNVTSDCILPSGAVVC